MSMTKDEIKKVLTAIEDWSSARRAVHHGTIYTAVTVSIDLLKSVSEVIRQQEAELDKYRAQDAILADIKIKAKEE